MPFRKRENPSAEWFDTQRLQNDADGYLINPDTNDIYWYHGAPTGGLFAKNILGEVSNVLYLTSDLDTAVKFACQWVHDDEDLLSDEFGTLDVDKYVKEAGSLPTVLKITLKIPVQQVFDIRNAYSDAKTKELVKYISEGSWDDPTVAEIIEGRMRYEYFDYTLGYQSIIEGFEKDQIFAKQLGFLGWLETEGRDYNIENEAQPCSLGIFTHLQTESYEVVDRTEVTDCSVLFRDSYEKIHIRKNPSAEWFETQRLQNDADGYLINPDTNDIYWFHGSPVGGLEENSDRSTLYLTSSIPSAVAFACGGYLEGWGLDPIILRIVLKVPAHQIFDIRNTDTDPRIDILSDQVEMDPKKRHYGLWYLYYDRTLGYEATDEQRQAAQNLGFRGWLETEINLMGIDQPCTIGIYTDVEPQIYEIVGEAEVLREDCDENDYERYRNNGEAVTKYTLYRGVPYSGLDLDDLEGRGGYGHQMLGGGLYTTDDYYVALNYATSDKGRYFRSDERKDKPCVYELELEIPEDEILYLDAQSINMSFCRSECTSAIPQIFGIRSPAFEFAFKDRNTGEEIWYLISEDEDPLQYDEDFKLECVNEVLSMYGLGVMGRLVDLDEYIEEDLYGCEDDDYEDDSHKDACESFEAYVFESGGDVDEALNRLQKLIDDEIREKSGLPHYGMYNEVPNVFWGGDSTDLASLAANHGYKVLWCSDWVSSGDEIVIVDDSIYNKGLTIVDDCT